LQIKKVKQNKKAIYSLYNKKQSKRKKLNSFRLLCKRKEKRIIKKINEKQGRFFYLKIK
jgi:hypothetical protein